MAKDPARDKDERSTDFHHLPERIPPEQWVEEQPAEAPHDPDGGRDAETEWMLRNTAG